MRKSLATLVAFIVGSMPSLGHATIYDQAYFGYANDTHAFTTNLWAPVVSDRRGYCRAIWDGTSCTAMLNFPNPYAPSPYDPNAPSPYDPNAPSVVEFAEITRSDLWYNVTQLRADSGMVRGGSASYAAHVRQNLNFLNYAPQAPQIGFWDQAHTCNGSGMGGYYAQGNISGIVDYQVPPEPLQKYIDDNVWAGVAYVQAYKEMLTTSPTDAFAALSSAQAIANWLMMPPCSEGHPTPWDYVNGGFWWSTDHDHHPTHANGLAMQLFAALYEITGQAYYWSWAQTVETWLVTNRFDSSTGLYYIHENGYSYPIPDPYSGEMTVGWSSACPMSEVPSCQWMRDVYATFDNAIMIQANLQFYDVTGYPGYLAHAQQIASAMTAHLWDGTNQLFPLSQELPNVHNDGTVLSPIYSGWASEAFLELWNHDHGVPDRRTKAKANIDTIRTKLMNTANNGYYNWAHVNYGAPGTQRSNRYFLVDQSAMQRVLATYAQSAP